MKKKNMLDIKLNKTNFKLLYYYQFWDEEPGSFVQRAGSHGRSWTLAEAFVLRVAIDEFPVATIHIIRVLVQGYGSFAERTDAMREDAVGNKPLDCVDPYTHKKKLINITSNNIKLNIKPLT